ncbi:unnamed protein product [Prorocentrum cordatum]|uniref:Uncharacterized protein n=1 Tax=Prorocentrum cordatum TaxID=2364126 RepID=A0ABN9V5R8_9DINO|nr:unnamed protein product [Polarella glacialis]
MAPPPRAGPPVYEELPQACEELPAPSGPPPGGLSRGRAVLWPTVGRCAPPALAACALAAGLSCLALPPWRAAAPQAGRAGYVSLAGALPPRFRIVSKGTCEDIGWRPISKRTLPDGSPIDVCEDAAAQLGLDGPERELSVSAAADGPEGCHVRTGGGARSLWMSTSPFTFHKGAGAPGPGGDTVQSVCMEQVGARATPGRASERHPLPEPLVQKFPGDTSDAASPDSMTTGAPDGSDPKATEAAASSTKPDAPSTKAVSSATATTTSTTTTLQDVTDASAGSSSSAAEEAVVTFPGVVRFTTAPPTTTTVTTAPGIDWGKHSIWELAMGRVEAPAEGQTAEE